MGGVICCTKRDKDFDLNTEVISLRYTETTCYDEDL
jgi:hypothetical protein